MLDALHAFGAQTLGAAWPTIWLLARILALSVALLLCVAYLILWERKLIAWMHVRHGPNRVRPRGLLQPIADVPQLLTKEVITPPRAGGVGGDSVSGQRCIGRYQRRLVIRRGDFVDWRLWRDSGRLGVEFQICVSGCDARRRADGLV